MKIGNLVKYKEDYNLKKTGTGLVIGSRNDYLRHSKEVRVYWPQESRSAWVFAEWLKEIR